MFIIGGGNRNNPFARSAGITIGKKPEPLKALELGRPAVVPSVAQVVESQDLDYAAESRAESLAALAEWESMLEVRPAKKFLYSYPKFGGSDIALNFEPYEEYQVTEIKESRGETTTVVHTYQRMAASLPRTVPLEGIDDRVWLRAVYSTAPCHTQRIEVRLGDEIIGHLCQFCPYNWSISIARPGFKDGMPLHVSGSKSMGWVFNRRSAGVDKDDILDPLEPWYVLLDMLRYLKNNRPELGLQ